MDVERSQINPCEKWQMILNTVYQLRVKFEGKKNYFIKYRKSFLKGIRC